MIITKLEALEKRKVKVYIDEEFHFLLYQKDIHVYKLKENETISDILYHDIIQNTVLRRAKQKALAILKFMDRTEQELIFKLKQADYTDEIISTTIEYIKSYHYIDDSRFAENYIHTKKSSKSKRQLQSELMQKGIEKEIIQQVISEEYTDEENEDTAIQKAIAKKCKNLDGMTRDEKRKISSYLYRKGFPMDLIIKYVKHDEFE